MHPPAATAWRRNVTRKPTLKTIAEISGLAVATVSRALNDAPDIRADTKVLVRRIAAEVGYVPNRAGVRLRTGRTNVISLVMSTEHSMMNHTAQLIWSVAEELRHTPYHLIITPFFAGQDPMEPVRYVVETGSADALIINQTLPDDPRVRYLVDRGFPFASHGRTEMGVEHPYFDYDNEAFSRIVMGKLAERGCKSVVMIAPPREQTYSNALVAGGEAAAREHGITFRAETEVSSDDMHDMIRENVTRRLAEDPSIDGYICGSIASTLAVIAAAEAAGREIGKTIQIATKEAVPFIQLMRKDIISLSEDVSRAGTFLAQAVIQAISDPELPPMQELEIPEDDEAPDTADE